VEGSLGIFTTETRGKNTPGYMERKKFKLEASEILELAPGRGGALRATGSPFMGSR
jgi:hypothetical protein